MSTERVGNVHINVPLTNLTRLYRPLESGFIANEVCPLLPVVKESDKYYVFTQGDFYGTEVDDLVPDRSEPREVDISHSDEEYFCERRELAWSVSDRERKNADDQLRLETNKQNAALGRLYLKREARIAALLRKTTNSGQLALGANAATKWDNAAADFQDVLTDVVTGITAIRQAIGIRPNTIVIPAAVAEGLHKSLFFQSVQQYTRGDVNAVPLYDQYPLLPPTLWGMRVLVPGVIQNTAKEGQTTSFSDVWGESVRLLYITPGPALEIPSVAYTFQSEPLTSRQWRADGPRVDRYATGFTIAEKVVASSAGYEINDCLT